MSGETLKGKLEAARKLLDACLAELGEVAKKSRARGRSRPDSHISGKDIALEIVNKIGDCEESDSIRTHVLDKRSVEAKVLLCFFISHKYVRNEWLTSGDIEKITSELGVKIGRSNASTYLAAHRQFLESGSARKNGQPTPYRLNRKGMQRFEQILRGKED